MDVPVMLRLSEADGGRERDPAENGETHGEGTRHGAESSRRPGVVRPKLKSAPQGVLYALSLGRR